MTWLLLLVLQISVAMAVGFVLGRIWQLLEQIWNTLLRSVCRMCKFGTLPSEELFPGIDADDPSTQ